MADCDNTPTDEQTPYRVRAHLYQSLYAGHLNEIYQDLTGLVIRDEFCFALGGFALIYSGTLVDPSTGATTRVSCSFSLMAGT
jgi:hypothetical protein